MVENEPRILAYGAGRPPAIAGARRGGRRPRTVDETGDPRGSKSESHCDKICDSPRGVSNMAVTESDVQSALKTLIDPNTGRDFVSGKSIRKIQVSGDDVTLDVVLAYPAKTQHETIRRSIADHL